MAFQHSFIFSDIRSELRTIILGIKEVTLSRLYRDSMKDELFIKEVVKVICGCGSLLLHITDFYVQINKFLSYGLMMINGFIVLFSI